MKPKSIYFMTDFGPDSIYLGQMRSVIMGINPKARIIDLAHDILPQNLPQASLYLQSSIEYIPVGSVILSVIDPEVGSDRKVLYINTQHHVIFCPDSGMVNEINSIYPFLKIINVDYRSLLSQHISNTFHGRDIFAPLAATVSLQKDFIPPGNELQYSDLKESIYPYPIINNDSIQGEVIFIDRFGNLVTNITLNQIHTFKNQMLKINFSNISIQGILDFYSEANPNKPIAYIGSMNTLEIGIYMDNLARKMNISCGEKVIIQHI